jgi:hypothetical protein
MNKSGRLALIKSTLSAIPIHTCFVLDMPPWFVKALYKIFKAFLWSGTDVVQGGTCVMAWVRVQRLLALGGLGILDSQRLGIALRTHWLWLQRTDPTRPCVTMPFKADATTMAFFNASVAVVLGDANSLLFWSDAWLHGQDLCAIAPDLVAAVSKRRRASHTVASPLDQNAWITDISGALTVQAIIQFLQLAQLLEEVALQPGRADSFFWRWSSSGQYSSASAYSALFLRQSSLLGAKELWKSKVPNKCRFFVWLALQGRCWTVARWMEHGLQNDGTCVLCCQDLETCNHILAGCSFSREVWFRIFSSFGSQQLTLAPVDDFGPWWLRSRKLVPQRRLKAFDSLVILVAWQ